MTGSTPSPDPAADVSAEVEADGPDETGDLPANRAERRARKSGQLPSHAGPQSAEHTHRGKGPRAHTKRG